MSRRRSLLLVLLLYVALDLSWPDVPGAFVFDPADSVESVDVGRTRLPARIVALPTPPRVAILPVEPSRGDTTPPRDCPVASSAVVSRLPRAATFAPPGTPEDSH